MQDECSSDVEDVEGSGAQFRAVPAREEQRFGPDFRIKRLAAENSKRLVLHKLILDHACLAARPLAAKHLELEGVCEFRFAEKGEEKYRFGLHQSGRSGGLTVVSIKRDQKAGIRTGDQNRPRPSETMSVPVFRVLFAPKILRRSAAKSGYASALG